MVRTAGLYLGAILMAALCAVISTEHAAAQSSHSHYAGQQTRAIKSLSEDDINALKNGAGWGLAKAAELNGLPGPLHLLELAHDIKITPAQRKQIERVFAGMRQSAQKLGAELIEAEKKLEAFFRSEDWKSKSAATTLEALVLAAAHTRGKLRSVHLKAHLQMPPILSAHQIMLYNKLRGYGASDPCVSVPKGHDPVMWRKHNGCK